MSTVYKIMSMINTNKDVFIRKSTCNNIANGLYDDYDDIVNIKLEEVDEVIRKNRVFAKKQELFREVLKSLNIKYAKVSMSSSSGLLTIIDGYSMSPTEYENFTTILHDIKNKKYECKCVESDFVLHKNIIKISQQDTTIIVEHAYNIRDFLMDSKFTFDKDTKSYVSTYSSDVLTSYMIADIVDYVTMCGYDYDLQSPE